MVKRVVLGVTLCVLAAGCGPDDYAPEPSRAPAQVGEPAAKPAQPPLAQPATPTKKIRVAFVTNNASDFWKIAEAGTKKAVGEFGCEVMFRIPAGGTAQEQQQIVEDLIVSGVSGIAISPNDPKNWTETLNKYAAKVNLITQDSDAPDSNRTCYIGTNNYEAGVAAGALIKKALPEGGKIMMFVGKLDAQNAQDRKGGIEDTLKGTNITIIDTLTDETDRAKAMANVQDTLVTHPDVGCLVGLWSYNGPAILNAVRDSGKLGKVKIACFDEEEETLIGVKEGQIVGTIVQQPFEFGYQSVKLLVQLAKGDQSGVPATKQLYVPVKTITPENVDEFRTTLHLVVGEVVRKALGLIALLVALIALASIWEYTHWGQVRFVSTENVRNLLTWIGLFGILSLGQALVIITGGIDLSVGSVVGLVGISGAMMLNYGNGVNPLVMIAACFGIALLIGVWHGFLIARVQLQPFVVTLCGLFFYRGIARLLTDDQSQGFGTAYLNLRALGNGYLWDIVPVPFVILLGLAVCVGAYLHGAPQGRHLFALGASEEAARFSGIRTDRLKIAAYALCSLLTAVGGLLLAFKINSLGPSDFGSFYELYAIAGAVLGGCSLRGGSGNVLGVVIGASLIVVLRNLVNILSIPSQMEYVVIGGAILAGVGIDELFSRRGLRPTRSA